jgi:hypothetical protein
MQAMTMATRLNMLGGGGVQPAVAVYVVRKITQIKKDKAGDAKTYCREDGRNWICTVKL